MLPVPAWSLILFVLFHFQNEVNSVVPLDSASTPSTVVVLDLDPSCNSGFRGRIRQRARRGEEAAGGLPGPLLSRGAALLGALRGSVIATVLGAQESTMHPGCRMKPEPCPMPMQLRPWPALLSLPVVSSRHASSCFSSEGIFLSASANRVGLQCTGCSQLSPAHSQRQHLMGFMVPNGPQHCQAQEGEARFSEPLCAVIQVAHCKTYFGRWNRGAEISLNVPTKLAWRRRLLRHPTEAA